MKYAVLAALGLAAGSVTALGVGCESQNRLNVTMEEGASAPHANLPAVPTLPPPPYPVQLPDGAYTIYGIRHTAARNWSKTVTVRGHIVEVYVPMTTGPHPHVCGERDHCNEERPHIYIADADNTTDPELRMQVTGYAQFQSEITDAQTAAARAARNPPRAPAAGTPAAEPAGPTVPVDFYPGAEIAVTGTFTRRAPNGQADSNGLIQYSRHTTITPSPQAPLLPGQHPPAPGGTAPAPAPGAAPAAAPAPAAAH